MSNLLYQIVHDRVHLFSIDPGEDSEDRVLVDSEGADYARYASY